MITFGLIVSAVVLGAWLLIRKGRRQARRMGELQKELEIQRNNNKLQEEMTDEMLKSVDTDELRKRLRDNKF